MDLERAGVKVDWVRMLEASECSNILLLVASIANSFVGECILEAAALLYLCHGLTLLVCYQITFLIPPCELPIHSY